MKEIELYGFSGKLGTGKNYVAEKLFLSMLPKKNTLVMAHADQIKVDCCVRDKVEYSLAFHKKDDRTRRLLQVRGTEDGRDKHGEDLWINYLNTWMKVYQERGIERVIVTDVRFPNELKWIKQQGGIMFRVEAPNRNRDELSRESEGDPLKLANIRDHASETGLDDPEGKYSNFNYVIYNDYDDQPNVANNVKNIIRELMYQKPVRLTIFCDMDDTICECAKFYKQIIDQTVSKIKKRIEIDESTMGQLLNKHVYSFERRYYTRDDFARSLVNMTVEAFLAVGSTMELKEEFMKEIYNDGLEVYNKNYEPLHSDSLDRVRQMRGYGQVVIFTLGDHTEQMKKVAYMGLLDFPVEIFTHKDSNMFRYLKAKYPSEEYVMIGDSYHRDIIPAREAGIKHLVNVTKSPDAAVPEPTSASVGKWDGIQRIERLNDELMEFLGQINKGEKPRTMGPLEYSTCI